MNVLPDVSSLPSPDDIYVTMVSKKLKQDIKFIIICECQLKFPYVKILF